MKNLALILFVLMCNVGTLNSQETELSSNNIQELKYILLHDSLNRAIDIKVGEHLYDAGKNMETGFIAGVGGVIITALLTGATYDKEKNYIPFYAFVPALMGGIVSIFSYINAASDFKDAGELMKEKK